MTEDSLEKDNHQNKEGSFQKRTEDGSVDEGKSGSVKVEGAEEDSDVEMPKILGDVFESLAGACGSVFNFVLYTGLFEISYCFNKCI